MENIESGMKSTERVELLTLGYHLDKRVFLDRESAELERKKRVTSRY